jgi:dTDP-4-amino-4,6-dideoxy-D-galactose acyltransferase
MADCADEVGELLDWDSQFFGRRIGRLKNHRLSSELMPKIDSWYSKQKIECVYFLADASDPETSRLAAEHQFQFVDTRITLELMLSPANADLVPRDSTVIREAESKDLPTLREMAGRLHRDSRFFFDKRFNAALSERMFQLWIEKSYAAQDGCVLIAEYAKRVAGYIACRSRQTEPGQIDLIGVDNFAQGKGLATKLISAALQWFRTRNVQCVLVVTQERNVRAQRLYQRSGFVTRSVELWYHRWSKHLPSHGQS